LLSAHFLERSLRYRAFAVEYLKENVHPPDLAFRPAELNGIVLLDGGGFETLTWSLRVSLANLPDDIYKNIDAARAASPEGIAMPTKPRVHGR
jgi:aspartate 4-decarboxylase